MKKVRFTSYIDESVKDSLKKLSDKTRVPQTKYVQEALEMLLKKYEEESK